MIEVEKGRGIKIKVEKQEFRCLARNFLPDLNFLVWLKNYTHLARSVQKSRALISGTLKQASHRSAANLG